VRSVIESCCFIFEQSAYFEIDENVMAFQLQKAQLQNSKVGAFVHVWREESPELLKKLRSKTITPLELNSVGWRMDLQISQSTLNRLKLPVAIMDLNLKSSSASSKIANESLTLEFTHDELYDFFNKLELIQEQLDNLG